MLKDQYKKNILYPSTYILSNTGAFKYIKQILTDKKGEKIAGDLNTATPINGQIFQTESIRQQRS